MEHRAITGAVFELVETFELDVCLVEESWPTRVEIYQAADRPDLFRCRVWQSESYRIQSTFPQSGGTPAHEPSDEVVLVDASHHLRCDWDPSAFEAGSAKHARRMVEDALLAFLDHATGERGPAER